MLDPEYLANVSIDLEKLYSQLETDILCDIARRIRQNDFSMTSTAEYQKQVLQSLGMSQSEVSKRISKTLDISNRKVKDIINSSSYRSLDSDNVIFKEAFDKGLIGSFNYNSTNFKVLINEGIVALNGELKNICKSTAKVSQQAFIHACDKAYLAIQSGGIDSDTAITNVIKELTREGINIVQYKTGAIRKVDSAIRNAVRTATNQTACKCQDKNFEEMGGNLVEVSSHMGARPDHAFWQGKIYWRKEKYKNYSNFEISTGYGTGEGLGGWNCRHSFYPFFEGLSSKSFQQYRLKKNKEYYNLTQEQRHNERKIREWDKRNKVCEAAGIDNSKELSKVREWKNRQKQFLGEHPELKRDYAREKVVISMKNGKIDISDVKVSGALDPSSSRASKHAEQYYESVRKMKTDYIKVANNTDMSIDDALRIKKYLFVDEHDLLTGKRRFDADYSISESWRRLIEGKNIQDHDYTLIKHEKYEYDLVTKGLTQEEAHTKASLKYNYRKEVMSIMLKLINVKRNNNIIEANYIPEGTNESGYIKMDLTTNEILESEDTSSDIPGIQTMLVQAAKALPHIADDIPFKNEYIHTWY